MYICKKKMKDVEELRDFLEERGLENTTFFTNPDFISAVIGLTDDGRLIYDYEKMIEDLSKQDGIDEEGAMEFIDYNTIRTIPYMGSSSPIIMYERL